MRENNPGLIEKDFLLPEEQIAKFTGDVAKIRHSQFEIIAQDSGENVAQVTIKARGEQAFSLKDIGKLLGDLRKLAGAGATRIEGHIEHPSAGGDHLLSFTTGYKFNTLDIRTK